MRMSNEKKKEVLLNNFEIINKNFGENNSSISESVIKMFSIDLDTAIDMWKHIIKKYEDEVKGSESYRINA